MAGKYTKDSCICIMRDKQAALAASGITRLLCRSDLSCGEVEAIKAFLGPWPRALEAAGLKEARNDGKTELNRQKRIRAKRSRTAALKSSHNTEPDDNQDEEISREIKETAK